MKDLIKLVLSCVLLYVVVFSSILIAVVLFPTRACAGPAGYQLERSLSSSPLPQVNDQGGTFSVRQIGSLRGSKRVVDGMCASACLLLIDETTCATPKGVLGWHAARYKLTGTVAYTETDLILASYPMRLQQVIRNRGGMQERIQFIRADKVLPSCQ